MPKQYVAMRDKFYEECMTERGTGHEEDCHKFAKEKAAKIFTAKYGKTPNEAESEEHFIEEVLRLVNGKDS
jgi:hypothetical protein